MNDGRSNYRVAPSHCPSCLEVLDTARAMVPKSEQRAPAPNDATMCVFCGAFLIYTDDMALRELRAVDRDSGALVLELLKVRQEFLKRRSFIHQAWSARNG